MASRFATHEDLINASRFLVGKYATPRAMTDEEMKGMREAAEQAQRMKADCLPPIMYANADHVIWMLDQISPLVFEEVDVNSEDERTETDT